MRRRTRQARSLIGALTLSTLLPGCGRSELWWSTTGPDLVETEEGTGGLSSGTGGSQSAGGTPSAPSTGGTPSVGGTQSAGGAPSVGGTQSAGGAPSAGGGPHEGVGGGDSHCVCTEYEVCSGDPGACVCVSGRTGEACELCDESVGYIEWPAGSGACILNACSDFGCPEGVPCTMTDEGTPFCNCPGTLTGSQCNQRWQTITIPPHLISMALDSQQNAWFVTSRGLLYWDFKQSPADLSDDAWQLFVFESHNRAKHVVVDDDNIKWITSNRSLERLDDGGTPLDLSDDDRRSLPLPVSDYEDAKKVHLDAQGRIWYISEDYAGVSVLEDISTIEDEPAPWIDLFATEKVRDLKEDATGLWLATDSGLHFVDTGASLVDPDDDQWLDLSDAPALDGQVVESIVIDSAGGKWFNTQSGIVSLTTGDDIFDTSQHSWLPFFLQKEGEAFNVGPVIAIDAQEKKWLKAPWGSALRVNPVDALNDGWTECAPDSSPVLQSLNVATPIHELAIDELGHKWLSSEGNLYYFDDRATPLDLADDLWVFVGRESNRWRVGEFFVVPQRGLWIRGNGLAPAPNSCSTWVLYFDLADPLNSLDDQWSREHPVNELGDCRSLWGFDARGMQWSRTHPLRTGDVSYFLWPDDSWTQLPIAPFAVSYSGADDPFFNQSLIAFDPRGGVWFGDTLFDYGDSLADKSDDQSATIDSFRARTMAIDSQGGKWFGYGSSAFENPTIPSTLRYLDDGSTAFDVTDDTWINFGAEDGLSVDDIANIQIDPLDRKWILGALADSGTYNRLCSLNDRNTPAEKSDDEWSDYRRVDGLAGDSINKFVIDGASDLWIATDVGLSYLHLEE